MYKNHTMSEKAMQARASVAERTTRVRRVVDVCGQESDPASYVLSALGFDVCQLKCNAIVLEAKFNKGPNPNQGY